MVRSARSQCFQNTFRKYAVSVFLTGCVIISLPRAHGGETRKGPVVDPVVETLLSNASAFERGDMGALNELWSDDDSLVVFENRHANHGWTDYRDHHLAPELAEMKHVRYRLSDIRTHPSGRTAWATFKYTISADLPDRRAEGEGVGTAVLQKKGSGWRIVHWHTSSSRRPPAGAQDQKTP